VTEPWLTDLQPRHSQIRAFGIYGDLSAYWLAREPNFTHTQYQELELDYASPEHLPGAYDDPVLTIRRGRPAVVRAERAQPRRRERKRQRNLLPATRPDGLQRPGNY
jgi:hypothetical protein